MGVGMVVITDARSADAVMASAREAGVEAWLAGRIVRGSGQCDSRMKERQMNVRDSHGEPRGSPARPPSAMAQAPLDPRCTDPDLVGSANEGQDACQKALDLLNYMTPQLGTLIAGGNATIGQGGTLGGLGHFAVSVRGNVMRASLPDIEGGGVNYGDAQRTNYATEDAVGRAARRRCGVRAVQGHSASADERARGRCAAERGVPAGAAARSVAPRHAGRLVQDRVRRARGRASGVDRAAGHLVHVHEAGAAGGVAHRLLGGRRLERCRHRAARELRHWCDIVARGRQQDAAVVRDRGRHRSGSL